LQCVAVCCSVLQCVAVCVAVRYARVTCGMTPVFMHDMCYDSFT